MTSETLSVLVTGASSGLGAHFARLVAQNGHSVILAARRLEPLEALKDEITSNGGRAISVRLDVSEEDSIGRAFAQIHDSGERADVVINNAGVTDAKPALDITAADWDRVVDTNLRGVFLMAQAAARRMKANGGGSIINVASILGHRVAGGVASYTASKAGVVRLTEALALEWARYGIRVNALCPGYIETDLNREFFESEQGKALIKRIPHRRLGRPADLDGALLLLASDAGRYITGTSIVVDGGHLVSSL
ncbi:MULTISPECIES: SDR family oxidoreductase [unclassified Chelatococcus]|uniref:SDR family NAD(P)-dependent oxidoreductase n=1 Tax=unclassified Chelatococcus TaxID=2638111 RepID=UPI001BD03318|nr:MULTISPECIES: SDR family oxidoreductase [unclassified Chelatococcus]MBS7701389.1 SDR family oxidoreductase [Chelatococcus sp. YT9]MBX3557469.1 SDR family oxidoreductase [Chelatococcus sp.]